MVFSQWTTLRSACATVIQVTLCYLNMILKNFSIGKQGSYIICKDTGIKSLWLFLGATSLPTAVILTIDLLKEKIK